MCPIQLFCLLYIVVIKQLFPFTLLSTSLFLIFYFQLIFPSLIHIHISSACNLSISAFRNVHVSHPYITTGHTSTITILFFNSLLILFVSTSLLLLNASFASAILAFTLFRLLPSSVIMDPRYLKLATCSTFFSSIMMLTIPLHLYTPPLPLFLNIHFHVKFLSSFIQFIHQLLQAVFSTCYHNLIICKSYNRSLPVHLLLFLHPYSSMLRSSSLQHI